MQETNKFVWFINLLILVTFVRDYILFLMMNIFTIPYIV